MASVNPQYGPTDPINSGSGRSAFTPTSPDRKSVYKQRITPAQNPNNPYERNTYKIKNANTIWENYKPCQKDFFNHSVSILTLVGTVGPKSKQAQTGYSLGINYILKTLNPFTGEYFAPACFCLALCDPSGNNLAVDTTFNFSSSNLQLDTGYHKIISPGQRLTGAADPDGLINLVEIKAPFFMRRFSVFGNFIEDLGKRTTLAMWPPLWVYNPLLMSWSWDCDHWSYMGSDKKDSEGNTTLQAIFCFEKCDTDLCSEKRVVFTYKYKKDKMTVTWKSPKSGMEFKVYWGSKEIGKFYWGSGSLVTMGTFSISAAESLANPVSMLLLEHPDICVGNDRFGARRISCAKTGGVVTNPCEGDYGREGESYRFVTSTPVYCDTAARSPQFKVSMKSVEADYRGVRVWYPWGAIWFYVGESDDGPWYPMFSNPLIVCNEDQEDYCVDNWFWQGGPYNHFALYIANSVLWYNCCKSQIGGLTLLDKLG